MNRHLILLVLGLLLGGYCFSQEDPCDNEFTHRQSDSLKKALSLQGFIVIREASVSMESEYDLPIIMQLTGGSVYQIVFIGDRSSDRYEVRMYDYHERQVVYQKKDMAEDKANFISYAYEPRLSEYHLIKPMQANTSRKTNLCGHVIVLKKATPGAPLNGTKAR